MGFKTEKELEDYLTDSGQWAYKRKQRTPAQLKKLSESMITEADKKPKPAAVNIPLPKIDFTPIPTVASTMSPEDRAMEQRFNQMMEQDRKEKIRNQNSGLAGLLGGGSKLYE